MSDSNFVTRKPFVELKFSTNWSSYYPTVLKNLINMIVDLAIDFFIYFITAKRPKHPCLCKFQPIELKIST